MKIYELTRSQLQELRSEIVLNSLFLKDYENSLGIEPKECESFFEGYVEQLYMFAGNQNLDFFEIADKYDNIENLYGFWCENYGDW